jgi:hypothetical protein
MRKHSQQYIKGIPGCKTLREHLMKIETYTDIEQLVRQYRDYLASRKNRMDHPHFDLPGTSAAAEV